MDLGADYYKQVDAFGYALATHTRHWTMLEVMSACVSCCLPLARCLLDKRAMCSSERQAMTPARYDEGGDCYEP